MDSKTFAALRSLANIYAAYSQGIEISAIPPNLSLKLQSKEFIESVITHRMTMVLKRLCVEDILNIHHDFKKIINEHAKQAIVNHSRLKTSKVAISNQFTTADVRFLIVKGSSLAGLAYQYPSDRLFGDIDILVHPDDLTTAWKILTNLGFQVPLRPKKYRWHSHLCQVASSITRLERGCQKGRQELAFEDLEVDLHWNPRYEFKLRGKNAATLLNLANVWQHPPANERESAIFQLLFCCLHFIELFRPLTQQILDMGLLMKKWEIHPEEIQTNRWIIATPLVRQELQQWLEFCKNFSTVTHSDASPELLTNFLTMNGVPDRTHFASSISQHLVYGRDVLKRLTPREKCLYLLGYFFPESPGQNNVSSDRS